MNKLYMFKQYERIIPKLRPACVKINSTFNYYHNKSLFLKNTEQAKIRAYKNEFSRFICSCFLLKKDSKSSESDKSSKSVEELQQKHDKEFKKLLKDVSKDFEAGNETEERLDNIRKKIDKVYSETEETLDNVEKLIDKRIKKIHEVKNEDSKENREKNSENNGDEDSKNKRDEDSKNNRDEDSKKNREENTDKFTSEVKNLESYNVQDKFKEFDDKDAKIIYSYEEELLGLYDENEATYHIKQEEEIKYEWQKAKRGIHGVFDIEELVEVLRKEKLFDISVVKIPHHINYADFMVLATARSSRHSAAVSEFINKLYKAKKHVKDPFLKIDGEKISTWKAVDMGNIVLHIFLKDTRAVYDIESLWLFDGDYDSGGIVHSDPALQSIEEQMAFFNEMELSEVENLTNENSSPK